ncbi:MAG: hypothetical protein JWM55_417 [Acidimicrobiaceae bacterium]|nr:hypothetical protein [Acidimicrobiaceae bacterium]
MSEDCDLCEAAEVTKRYFEDELCWVGDCEICLVPMVVWREHGASPPPEVKRHLYEVLGAVANDEFPSTPWSIDERMRNIPDHYHAHARPPYFWRRHRS